MMRLITLLIFLVGFYQVNGAPRFEIPTVLEKVDELYLGYFDDPRFYNLFKDVSTLGYRINVIVGQENYKDVALFVKKHQMNKVNIINLHGDPATPWARDYMLFVRGLDDRENYIWDMPYGRSGEEIPSQLEEKGVGKRYLPNIYREYNPALVGSSEYGGNILALPYELILVGQNMSVTGKKPLREQVKGEFLELDVDWLETGHVDEIISLLPTKGKGCDSFVLIEGSPSLAIMLAWLGPRGKHRNDFYNCFSKKKFSKSDKKFCSLFFALNLDYQEKISVATKMVDKKIKERSGCANIRWVRFPVLFAPGSLMGNQEQGAGAISISSNPINLLSLDDVAIVGDQEYAPFKDEIIESLGKYGIKIRFVESTHLNDYLGGIHCNINVKRKRPL